MRAKPQRNKKIIISVLRGQSIKKIARRYHISVKRVYAIIDKTCKLMLNDQPVAEFLSAKVIINEYCHELETLLIQPQTKEKQNGKEV